MTHLLGGLKAAAEGDCGSRAPGRGRRRGTSSFWEEPTIGLPSRTFSAWWRSFSARWTPAHGRGDRTQPDLIAEADWLIDLGPEGGDGGDASWPREPQSRSPQSREFHTQEDTFDRCY